MNARRFHDIYRELIDDNPLAVRAVLKVLDVRFTGEVPTLAVTLEARPVLLVNLGFIERHCETDDEVKSVICHEFLHVLLRHTERFTSLTPAEHLALDAVINAIIHRSLGPSFSSMMSRYYASATRAQRLLRPPTPKEASLNQRGRPTRRPRTREGRFRLAWHRLYEGLFVADDIRDLAKDFAGANDDDVGFLLGGHGLLSSEANTVPGGPGAEAGEDGQDAGNGATGSPTEDAARALADALDTALRSMNGGGVFRSPRGRGVGAPAYRNEVRAADEGVERWRRDTLAVLRRHLLPDPRATGRDREPADFVLPVLSPGDRRAALRALWSPFLPDATWETERERRSGSAHVYLDVSGSMNAEMPIIVTLLGQLSGWIRRPFWAFSTEVAPARIEGRRLIADTTGGTSMACVLEHIGRTKPRAAVVVTDGYIERLTSEQVAAAGAARLHVVVTRDGSPVEVARAGLPYTQLGRLPS